MPARAASRAAAAPARDSGRRSTCCHTGTGTGTGTGAVTPVLPYPAHSFALAHLRAQEAESYASDNGIFFMETSAKTATNVNELFVAIARKLPKNTPQPRPGGQGLVIAGQTAGDAAAKKGCC